MADPLPLIAWITGLATGLGIIARSRPVRWLWRRNVSGPFADKMREVVNEAVAAQLNARPWTNGESFEAIRAVQADVAELRQCVARLMPEQGS